MGSSEVTDIDARLRSFPGAEHRLQLLALEELTTEIELARLGLDAVFVFAGGLCEPLSADLALCCCDSLTGYPLSDSAPSRPFWMLRCRDLPRGVQIRPAWEDEELDVTDKLTLDAVLAWLGRAINQDCPGDQTVGWREVLFRAARVRLPIGKDISGDTLPLRDGAGVIEHPVERRDDGLWVSGPIWPRTLSAPIELSLTNETGLLTFDVRCNWSVWADEDAPGFPEILLALDKVRGLGWERPCRDS